MTLKQNGRLATRGGSSKCCASLRIYPLAIDLSLRFKPSIDDVRCSDTDYIRRRGQNQICPPGFSIASSNLQCYIYLASAVQYPCSIMDKSLSKSGPGFDKHQVGIASSTGSSVNRVNQVVLGRATLTSFPRSALSTV